MPDLSERTCVPCRRGAPPLSAEEAKAFTTAVNGWSLVNGHHIEKEFTFADFKSALAFVNAVGALAEEQGHHPDVYLTWAKVQLIIWTHKIGGLTESDFILAAKIDRL